jgi:HlyD family secretion protein
VTLVNVGTQVSGTVSRVFADFNQPVRAGEPLAEIDPSLIRAQLVQLEANLNEAAAQLRLARSKLARSEELTARGFVSGAQLDDERHAVEVAQARVRSIEAQIERERANLGYTVIRSPIDGVVIARSVDPGQTVAASFQTPTLFLIARDLRDMQIDTNVAEADVGGLRVGMPATFRVDALGDRVFQASVRQIRLNPKVEQNVVTYNVVLATRNDDGRLLPGMTAQVRIRVAAKQDVLRVPNTALRFRPADPDLVVAPPPGTAARAVVHVESVEAGRPVLRRVPVVTGISDGTRTEIVDDGALKAGDRVAVGELVQPPAGAGKPGGFRLRLF